MDQVHWHRIRREIDQDDAEQSLLDRPSNLIRQYVSDPDAGNRRLNRSIRCVNVQPAPRGADIASDFFLQPQTTTTNLPEDSQMLRKLEQRDHQACSEFRWP